MIEIEAAPGTAAAGIRMELPGSRLEITGDAGRSCVIRLEGIGGGSSEIQIGPGGSAGNVATVRLETARELTVALSPELQISVALQGPRGISGDSGAGEFQAAVTIGGHRGVYFDWDGRLRLASSAAPNPIPAEAILRNALSAGETGQIYQAGPVNGFSGLTPGESYFLGDDGQPTTRPPTEGLHQPLGTAASASILIVNIGEPVYF